MIYLSGAIAGTFPRFQGPEIGLRTGYRPPSRKSVPDRIRTCDLWYRKPMLYPLSYGDIVAIPVGMTTVKV